MSIGSTCRGTSGSRGISSWPARSTDASGRGSTGRPRRCSVRSGDRWFVEAILPEPDVGDVELRSSDLTDGRVVVGASDAFTGQVAVYEIPGLELGDPIAGTPSFDDPEFRAYALTPVFDGDAVWISIDAEVRRVSLADGHVGEALPVTTSIGIHTLDEAGRRLFVIRPEYVERDRRFVIPGAVIEVDLDSGLERELAELAPIDLVHDPVGDRLLVSVKTGDGAERLLDLDPRTGDWQFLTDLETGAWPPGTASGVYHPGIDRFVLARAEHGRATIETVDPRTGALEELQTRRNGPIREAARPLGLDPSDGSVLVAHRDGPRRLRPDHPRGPGRDRRPRACRSVPALHPRCRRRPRSRPRPRGQAAHGCSRSRPTGRGGRSSSTFLAESRPRRDGLAEPWPTRPGGRCSSSRRDAMSTRQRIYAILTVAGAVGPWWFNLAFMRESGGAFDLGAFVAGGFANPAAGSPVGGPPGRGHRLPGVDDRRGPAARDAVVGLRPRHLWRGLRLRLPALPVDARATAGRAGPDLTGAT